MITENCKYRNPLKLSGTAQESRYPTFLNPDLVKIDGKTTEDYKRIVVELAKITQYYDADNRRDGSWENFFVASNFNNDNPHIALFNAFIELIGYAQEDLNALTAKHLEFYYQDVLRLAKKAETADTAHILFNLANNVEGHLIETNTGLKAGKDAAGNELIFKTNKEIVVNKGVVSDLKSIYVQVNEANITTVYAANKANSSDGIGGDLAEDNPKWSPFGENQEVLLSAPNPTSTMPVAELGFAIVSDYLLLKEGNRIVYLTLTFLEPHGIVSGDLHPSDFTVLFSGEKDWIKGRILELAEGEAGIIAIGLTVRLRIEIPESEKAIIAYDEEIFEENFNTTSPIMKVLVNQSTTKNLYTKLSSMPLQKIDLRVNVFGVKNLVLQNETGTLDPSKPFLPFGNTPAIGSEFYIGSKEIFSKQLTKLTFGFDWAEKPGLFSTHYTDYDLDTVSESDFTVNLNALRGRAWNTQMDDSYETVALFGSDDEIVSSSLTTSFPDFVYVDETNEYTTDLQNGFVRMKLAGPVGGSTGLNAFGHAQYQKIYVKNAISLARSNTGQLPEEPYTPKSKSLTIDYEAVHEINLAVARDEHEVNGHFFHINPFGINKKKGVGIKLIPDYGFQGVFYIGLENLNLPQNLSVLFQVAEGSANPNKLPATINWNYLENDEWMPFNSVDVLSDSSNGLINSGIVEFILPKTMTSGNTRIAGDLYWICGEIASDTDSVCQMIEVHTQAVSASFENNENDLSHLAESLPKDTIAKLNSTDAAIRKVEQPYASFGARLPETEGNYYRRASERLRHKNRAISIWDYERIVLEEYATVYKVKCLNHTRMTEHYSEQAPGNVSLVVVSNLRNQNAVNPLQPTTSLSTLEAIKAFLTVVKDPFVALHVKNPFFEEVLVKFNVKFLTGKDPGFSEKQIHIDIKKFMSPWAYSQGEDIIFEGTMYKSKIINFIEELDYVDFVSCFKMFHVVAGIMTGLKDVEEIFTTKSGAILVSHTNHEIHVLTTEECECDDDNIQATTITDGIGTMTVGYDLEVNKP